MCEASRVRTVRLDAPDICCNTLDVVMCALFLKHLEFKGVDSAGEPVVHVQREINHLSFRFLTPSAAQAAQARLASAHSDLCSALRKIGKRGLSPWKYGSVLGTFAIICRADQEALADRCALSRREHTPGMLQSTYTVLAHDLSLENPQDYAISLELLYAFLPATLTGVHSLVINKSLYGLALLVQLNDVAPLLRGEQRPPLYAQWCARPSALAELMLCPRSPRFVDVVVPSSAAGLLAVMQSLATRTRTLVLNWFNGRITLVANAFIIELFEPLHEETDAVLASYAKGLRAYMPAASSSLRVKQTQGTMNSIASAKTDAAAGTSGYARAANECAHPMPENRSRRTFDAYIGACHKRGFTTDGLRKSTFMRILPQWKQGNRVGGS
jgi:hypothetical protein